MLKCSCMHNHVLRPSIPAGVTFLLIISNANPAVAGLREEAASYRTQGYEAQRRGDKVGALSNYQKAAALDPTYPTPNNDMGVLLEEAMNFSTLEATMQSCL